MIDHCISAFLERQDEKLYRIYVTDNLQRIAKNTAGFNGGEYPTVRYADLIDRRAPKKQETAEEIIDRIKTKLRNI